MTMFIPQYEDVRQPLGEFVAEHRKDIDEVIYKLRDNKPRRFPISDELREHIVILDNLGGLYAMWMKTAKPRRI